MTAWRSFGLRISTRCSRRGSRRSGGHRMQMKPISSITVRPPTSFPKSTSSSIGSRPDERRRYETRGHPRSRSCRQINSGATAGRHHRAPRDRAGQNFLAEGPLSNSREKWIHMQKKLVLKQCWIIDGDLGSYDAVKVRLHAADTIVLLDFPVGPVEGRTLASFCVPARLFGEKLLW